MENYKISKIQLTNFRNLSNQIITFSPGINCIFGENGNGKTNILEAVNVLFTKKSFRKNASFPQYLSVDGEKPEIIFSALLIGSENESIPFSVKITNEDRLGYLDGKPVKSAINQALVFINPFDSYGFHNNSSDRREFFDFYIGQIDSLYKKNLKNYTQVLRLRNNLLSNKPPKFVEQVRALNENLALLSYQLTERRKLFLTEIEKFTCQTFQSIFSEKHELKISLDSKILNMSSESILKVYENNMEKDIERGFTSYGPHKDDYVLLFDGLNSFDFCSLGQQKMSYLSLLFAYIELFRYKYMSYPIVLIDDVSGELDQHRWRRLVEYLEKREFQVLITTANEKFKEELDRINGANKILVTNGSIN